MTNPQLKQNDWRQALPPIKGEYLLDEPLAPFTWFRVGGKAECLFKPQDADDLITFWQNRPQDVPVTILGVGSNILVRDGGVKGIVIRLGKAFQSIEVQPDNCVCVGSAVPDMVVAKTAGLNSVAGLEFLRGIPGTIGGALAMNAGAYGTEIKDVLVEAYAIEKATGEPMILTPDDLDMQYRHTGKADQFIFTGALLGGHKGNKAEIEAKMNDISQKREETQPVKSRTGGSTFKNPVGHKAWELIDRAGCRGLIYGDAQVSELHCNFLINLGNATAHDLETLGEMVREKVKATSGVTLEWEIKRVGDI